MGEPKPAADVDGDQHSLEEAIVAETVRLYWGSRWTAPVGTMSAALVLFASLWGEIPSTPLWFWIIGIAILSLSTLAAIAVPELVAISGPQGLPFFIAPMHFLSGLGFGLLFWLDEAAIDNKVAQWTILAGLFAMSAGVKSMSTVNYLSLILLLPMWIVAASALVLAGVWVPAAGVLVFLAIAVSDELRQTEVWREVLELRFRESRQAEESAWRANHDELTGLLNRTGVLEELAVESNSMTSLFIDLDRFKEANDRFGHAAGDRVLQQVARRLVDTVRESDKIARIGGDEFFIIVDHGLTDDESTRLGESIITALEEPFSVGLGEEIRISASVGYTTLEAGEVDADRLMIEADHAMLQAKRRGRRQVAAFTSSLEEALRERSGLESSLRQAVRSRSIWFAAQPIFDLGTGDVRVVELLARWTLGSGSAIPPSVFIPLAEEIGLIDEVTEQVLDQAGRLLQQWQHVPELADAQVSVNVSPVQVSKGNLLGLAARVVAEYAIAPGRLVFELTESATVAEVRSTIELFEELRRLGVLLVLDDFGTGYSSLGHLLSLPLTGVKIDRSLIADLGGDPRQSAVMAAVRDLAAVLGHEVIAEGVENSVQMKTLLGMGIEFGQGFGLMRPVPAELLVEQLAMVDWHRSIERSSKHPERTQASTPKA